MPFQTPITIAKALEHIQAQEYVLPAIQREFTWSPEQVCALFDSLMRGYPIGSFLFWKVKAAESRDYVFYGFIRDYHALKAPHCPRLDIPADRPLTAILDGQQRLTSLLIGLRGSHAERMKGRWRNNPDAYPVKRLYLNIMSPAGENEQNLEYDFRFLTKSQAEEKSEKRLWFPVGGVLGFADAIGIHEYLAERDRLGNKWAFPALEKLRKVVKEDLIIAFYEEEAQDLDKVLNIFIRVNSFGEPLSYSDLLLSIATSQWSERDARDAIYGLVDDLNRDLRFKFSKDLILKAGLVLSGVENVRFKVTNFNKTNMGKLEDQWDEISRSITAAADTFSRYGFSEETLPATGPLIPVAYYIHKRASADGFSSSAAWADDRDRVRDWVIRSLLKAGVWGSGYDTLLTALRRAIDDSKGGGYPVVALEREMLTLGKSLAFQPEEILDLADTPYGNRRLFSLLALLYRSATWESQFHVDHVFPRSLPTKKKLLAAGVLPEDVERYQSITNGLANLQLLPGPINEAKQDKLPLDWAKMEFPDPVARGDYFARHDLAGLPDTIHGFLVFYELRRERIIERLNDLLLPGDTKAPDDEAETA